MILRSFTFWVPEAGHPRGSPRRLFFCSVYSIFTAVLRVDGSCDLVVVEAPASAGAGVPEVSADCSQVPFLTGCCIGATGALRFLVEGLCVSALASESILHLRP